MSATKRALQLIEPVRLRAEVVHGFGRGSKSLGFPTANMKIAWDADPSQLSEDERRVRNFAENHSTGIYCALGCLEEAVGEQKVYKVAMSMGWNPTFTDVKAKTIEPWILHHFAEDFYGCHLRLLVLGYVRPELKFESLEELKKEIAADGDFCAAALGAAELAKFQSDSFLRPWASTKIAANPTMAQPLMPPGITFSSGLRNALQELPALEPGFARLLLVRHGETIANAQGLLCGGGHDSELNPNGLEQAEELSEELQALLAAPPALLGSSPQSRAVASAEAIARRFPSAQRLVSEELREMRYGSLEGARISDVRGEMTVLGQQWRSGDTKARVGGAEGENPEDVLNRVMGALAKILTDQKDQTVLLVCHSWVNKALIAAVSPGLALQRLLDVPQRNCAVNILDFDCGSKAGAESRFRVRAVDLVAGSRDSRI